ncbi:hypothetical protein MCEMSE6_02306 [Oxalobacteraceae bacterium]
MRATNRFIHRFNWFQWLLVFLLPLASSYAKAEAYLEIVEFGKSGEKKTISLTTDEPKLFNIEMFTSWSHCEVAAIKSASSKPQSAWLRCWSAEESQVAMTCQGNDRQTIILGHNDKAAKRGSISLVCSN